MGEAVVVEADLVEAEGMMERGGHVEREGG